MYVCIAASLSNKSSIAFVFVKWLVCCLAPRAKLERTVVPSFACIVQLKRAAVGMLMHALSMKSDKRTR